MHQHRDLIRRSPVKLADVAPAAARLLACQDRGVLCKHVCDLSSLTCRVIDKTDETEGPDPEGLPRNLL